MIIFTLIEKKIVYLFFSIPLTLLLTPTPSIAGYWEPCTKDLKTNKYIIRDPYTGQPIKKTVRGFESRQLDSTRRYMYGQCYINDGWFLD